MPQFDRDQELAHVERLYGAYTDDDAPQSRFMRDLALRALGPFVAGHGLELGCSDGRLTERLAAKAASLHVVDAAPSSLAAVRARGLANVTLEHALFEDFKPRRRFDFIFASYVLEHVADPACIFEIARTALAANGKLLLVVPNARALSRQLARHMGLVDDLFALTANDLAHGHRRTFDRATLNGLVRAHGFATLAEGGLMLKILADFQLNQLYRGDILNETHVEGLYRLGLEYPDFCGSLFSVVGNAE